MHQVPRPPVVLAAAPEPGLPDPYGNVAHSSDVAENVQKVVCHSRQRHLVSPVYTILSVRNFVQPTFHDSIRMPIS